MGLWKKQHPSCLPCNWLCEANKMCVVAIILWMSIVLDDTDHVEEEAAIHFCPLLDVSSLDIIDIHD